MKSNITPDLNERQHRIHLEKSMRANASDLYQAWTEKFDLWFAQPGELLMEAKVDKPFFFYNRHDWGRHAHYGRFLELQQDRLIEMAWVTGKGGTAGAETVIRIEFVPQEEGTWLRLDQSGFEDEESAKGHAENWPLALDELDQKLTS